jgi:GNAT superfamily N-acetyltransferase
VSEAAPGEPARLPDITVDRVGPGGGVASDSAFGVALVTLWQQVAEAGGPVGFAPPVVRSEIAARAALLVDGVKTGRLIAVAANRARRLIGVGILRLGAGQQRHTGRVELLLVQPDHTRGGLGSRLLTELLTMAKAEQVRLLDVQIEDGAGLETFFGRFGFTEWGRRPGWIELGAGRQGPSKRDELLMGVTL